MIMNVQLYFIIGFQVCYTLDKMERCHEQKWGRLGSIHFG